MPELNPIPPNDREFPPGGSIFEFADLDQAKAFAVAVERQFNLGARVFDDAVAAARSHAFPFEQKPPVVHVDRAWWGTKADSKEWDAGWAREKDVDALAQQFGGEFIGT